jgi:hypothetical protein
MTCSCTLSTAAVKVSLPCWDSHKHLLPMHSSSELFSVLCYVDVHHVQWQSRSSLADVGLVCLCVSRLASVTAGCSCHT